jgi:hypothetical protein
MVLCTAMNDHVMLTGGSISPHASMKSLWHTMLLRGTAKHSESPCHADARKHLTGWQRKIVVTFHGALYCNERPCHADGRMHLAGCHTETTVPSHGVPGRAEAAPCTAQSVRWFASLTMTWLFTGMFMVDAASVGAASHSESPCHADGRRHLTACHCATTVPSHGAAKHSEKPCHADGRRHLTACYCEIAGAYHAASWHGEAQRKPMSC